MSSPIPKDSIDIQFMSVMLVNRFYFMGNTWQCLCHYAWPGVCYKFHWLIQPCDLNRLTFWNPDQSNTISIYINIYLCHVPSFKKIFQSFSFLYRSLRGNPICVNASEKHNFRSFLYSSALFLRYMYLHKMSHTVLF